MLRLLFFILLACLGLFQNKRIELDVQGCELTAQYVLPMPSRDYDLLRVIGNGCEGRDQISIFSFKGGECLYITNDASLCTIANLETYISKEVTCELAGDTWRRIVNQESNYFAETSGYNESSGFYRDWQSFDVCIGYYGVPRDKKELFDAAIDNLRVRRVYSTSKNTATKVFILTPRTAKNING
ncbi:MAG: hypothetical protein IJV32_03685 [Bacteroidales bacterium]|nr:hypothetical protein [Bacteroidales bacterium]